MWTAKGRKQCDSSHFDAGYLLELKGQTVDPDRELKVATFVELIGDVTGKRVLDLGGGTTLSGKLSASQHRVVDFSLAGCQCVVKQHSECEAVWADALEYLREYSDQFDVTLCFALLAYLPESALDVLLDRCPSPVLCIAEAKGKGYLQYETRITAYCEQDFVDASARHNWRIVKVLPNDDHFYGRLERA